MPPVPANLERAQVIRPVTPCEADAGMKPGWDGATFVAEIQDNVFSDLVLETHRPYLNARLLVRHGRLVRGFIEGPIVQNGDTIRLQTLRGLVSALPETQPQPAGPAEPFTVIVCTRERPATLKNCLESLRRLDYPAFDVLVVDNGSRTPETKHVVEGMADPRFTYAAEPRAGLSIARNTGVRLAGNAYLAFTDDDVVVDPHWLTGLMAGFHRSPDVECVTGAVPTAQLESPAQAYFDKRVAWASDLPAQLYSLEQPPLGDPLFPFRFGSYGTGANFAVKRESVIRLGGFDELLGVGSRTGGGEDIDYFVRTLLADGALVREPAAIVWHLHRRDVSDLRKQIAGYGLGLGAVVAKLAFSRRLPMVLLRVSNGYRQARAMTTVQASTDVDWRDLRRAELLGIVKGAFVYLTSRMRALFTRR
jgi:GT2 family glycosyltransferase